MAVSRRSRRYKSYKVELNLFLKLLFPASAFYLWETEGLRLSQSPHDTWEGPGPQPSLRLHPSVCLHDLILAARAI